jgi:hypothetical protein
MKEKREMSNQPQQSQPGKVGSRVNNDAEIGDYIQMTGATCFVTDVGPSGIQIIGDQLSGTYSWGAVHDAETVFVSKPVDYLHAAHIFYDEVCIYCDEREGDESEVQADSQIIEAQRLLSESSEARRTWDVAVLVKSLPSIIMQCRRAAYAYGNRAGEYADLMGLRARQFRQQINGAAKGTYPNEQARADALADLVEADQKHRAWLAEWQRATDGKQDFLLWAEMLERELWAARIDYEAHTLGRRVS